MTVVFEVGFSGVEDCCGGCVILLGVGNTVVGDVLLAGMVILMLWVVTRCAVVMGVDGESLSRISIEDVGDRLSLGHIVSEFTVFT